MISLQFYEYILYVFFWVFPRRPIVVCRRFGTLYQFHLLGLDVKYDITLHPALEDGTDRGFRNVGKQQSDAGEIPKRIHKIFILYTITLRNFVVPTLSMVGDPLSGNGCGSPNHI